MEGEFMIRGRSVGTISDRSRETASTHLVLAAFIFRPRSGTPELVSATTEKNLLYVRHSRLVIYCRRQCPRPCCIVRWENPASKSQPCRLALGSHSANR